MDNNTFLYTGSPINPEFTLNIGGRLLDKGKDYDVEIDDNINVGTAHVTIKGKGKYTGTISKTFEITPVPARSLSFFADNTEFDYTGKPCIMQVVVKFGDITLEEGTDYTVEYVDNIMPGTANARISFLGNYMGVMEIPFVIYGSVPKKEPQPPKVSAAEEKPAELVNITRLSSYTVKLGENVVVSVHGKGGTAPYSYAVYYCRSAAKQWMTARDFEESHSVEIKPQSATQYTILTKVKDSEGNIARRFVNVTVEKPANAKPAARPVKTGKAPVKPAPKADGKPTAKPVAKPAAKPAPKAPSGKD